MPRSTTATQARTAQNLEDLVTRIEANPGRMINPAELAEAYESADVSRVVESLPEGLTREDLVDILKLAMLTECATETYADVFREGARRHDAPWLARFVDKVWVPDESTHTDPFRAMLLTLGFEEAELDRQIRDVQQMPYEHCCEVEPLALATFGMIQEQLTDQWHGLIANLVKPAAPHAAHIANRVKGRETLHTMWYREMAAISIAGDPGRLDNVATAIMGFKMPGNQLVPELQGQALRWMPHLGVDFALVAKDLVRNFSEVAGSPRRSGELLTEVASRRGFSVGPIPMRFARVLMARLGGFGYEVVGQAIIERVGLPLARWRQAEGAGLRSRIKERIQSAARGFVSRRVDLRTVTGETGGAS